MARAVPPRRTGEPAADRPASTDGARGRYEAVVRTLRTRGGRMTPARAAIVRALLAAEEGGHGHPTANDIVAVVQAERPDVHRSTVYRTLESLESAGVVEHAHLGHGRAVYHLADRRHQHLVCDACGAVTEMPDDALDGLAGDLLDRYGFAIRPHHFAILGRCACCVSAPDGRMGEARCR